MFGYREFKDDTEKETIKLYDLKFERERKFFGNEEQEFEDKEEDLSKNKYYRINDKKLKELEKAFKQLKTKINLNINLKQSFDKGYRILPEILFNIKKEKNKNSCIVYNEKYFSKLIEIETSDSDNILFVEKLENKDLIFLVSKGDDYELLVYRLMPEQNKGKKRYFLSQKIKETFEGYEIKYEHKNRNYYGFEDEKKAEPIMYNLFYIKAISRNRFFCISNYGFKIYALNKKNEYELVLLEPYEKIDFIYEIDAYKFIFGLNIRTVKGFGFCGNAYTCYYKLILNKIELKNIDKTENKSKQEESKDYKKKESNEKNNDYLDIFKVKEKLKFSFISQNMFEYNQSSPLIYDIPIYFSDFVTLKNKFFIIMIYNNILIFNLETGKKIKRFEIFVDNRGLEMDIKKWDCKENDEFILIVNNNVILFKLNESSTKISLNILNYSYFPVFAINENEGFIFKDLKKISNQKNRFYSYNNEFNDISIY